MDSNKVEQTSLSSTIKPYIVGISGGSASGKTSVADIIFKLVGIKECVNLSMDSYYKDLT
jgi:uridine kinase